MKHINPIADIGDDFLSVQNPARYIGHEYGIIRKDDDSLYTFAMAFPDLYEIGMSNSAIRILYNGLNAREGIRCERVFAPDTDFEELLNSRNIPLYTLENGLPLNEVDAVGVSIGYELGITGALSIFDTGKIPLKSADRGEGDPIVVAGGCGVTNPAPFALFFDAIFIGEAENDFFDIFEQAAAMKKRGATRAEQLAFIRQHPSMWYPGKQGKATRAVQSDFGRVPSVAAHLPIANIKPVQDHGVIEIMRGCPNGCRFCHAGVYYRPQRVKQPSLILEEADRLIMEGGHREISLTSLSSGDYPEIDRLLTILNDKYKSAAVSFQLPSLKVNSFTLPLLEKLSEVRKSGLTFAVETPSDAWQLSVNKEVFKDKLIDIILEAKNRGWHKAKFYFMVGLPAGNDERHLKAYTNNKTEEQEIVDFLLEIQEKTGIQCSVNVGTFIPKPHTAYERCSQLTREQSREKMEFIRSSLPRGKFKVSTHNPFVSFIEGLVTRGDERVGELLLEAYNRGCRLDAWEDHMKMDVWEDIINNAGWDVEHEITRARADDEELPWSSISLGPSPAFYKKEYDRSVSEKLTEKCAESCSHPCGVCNTKHDVAVHTDVDFDGIPPELLKNDRAVVYTGENNIPILYRCIFTFKKHDGGEFLPHLSTQEVIHKAFMRSGLPVIYTDGFNPQPRLELAASLSLGIESDCEVASCILRWGTVTKEEFISKMNASLPDILEISDCIIYPLTRKRKRVSLAAMLYGAEYEYTFKDGAEAAKAYFESDAFKAVEAVEKQELTGGIPGEGRIEIKEINGNTVRLIVPFASDRPLRNSIEAWAGKELYKTIHIKKLNTFATGKHKAPTSYFECFSHLASKHLPFMEKSRQEEADMLRRKADRAADIS
ncbi:MAG: TIGR03960 family B12-binding radical SAM protein [Treponema sp.]|nr:TIGR03960 family B12-binding radical SAM protein [Candidatus Treponema caballi]